MLWTDQPFVVLSDLLAVDPDLTDSLGDFSQSSPSGASISPTGIINQSIAACARVIQSRNTAMTRNSAFGNANGITSNHHAAIANTGLRSGGNVPRLRLGQIVVHSQYPGINSPIQQWVVYTALVMIYQSLTVRLAEAGKESNKRDYFTEQLEKVHFPNFRSHGLPYVTTPLPAPGAVFEQNSGIWSVANLSTSPLIGAIGGTYYVAITYVDQSSSGKYINWSTPNNAESGPSIPLLITIPGGTVLTISIASLLPPIGTLPAYRERSAYGNALMKATGWNIYIGKPGPNNSYDPASMCLQNAIPIPIATKTFTLPGDPVTNLSVMSMGQNWNDRFIIPDAQILFG
jgi:hypothetical protein